MLQIEMTPQEGVSSETEREESSKRSPESMKAKSCPEERGKRANLLSVYGGTAAEASCHPTPSDGSRAPTNTCLMTQFIHLHLCLSVFSNGLAHMHFQVFHPDWYIQVMGTVRSGTRGDGNIYDRAEAFGKWACPSTSSARGGGGGCLCSTSS